MRRLVAVGPFSVFFTNINRVMNLPGHSHFATVTLHFVTGDGGRGFPAFGGTYAAIQHHLMTLTEKPFQNMTNEAIADAVWQAFDGWTHEEITKWGGEFALAKVELAVRGVPDKIGHADGFTTYSVEGP